jgi:DUF1009 family protein
MTEKFCLIAGSGDLVTQIVRAAVQRGIDLHVLSLNGRIDLPGVAVTDFAPGQLDAVFATIRRLALTRVLLAGYVSQETWQALQDHPALGFMPGAVVGTAELARRFEDVLPGLTGASLIGIHDVAPELLAPDGNIAGPLLSPEAEASARSALLRARELGWRDIGQAVVVSPAGELEAEDALGTDALLSRIAAQRSGHAESGWILAKALKPQQPLSMDIPVIGPATVENARRAGISVIAVEAGGAVIVDRHLVEKAAVAAGISVVGLALAQARP